MGFLKKITHAVTKPIDKVVDATTKIANKGTQAVTKTTNSVFDAAAKTVDKAGNVVTTTVDSTGNVVKAGTNGLADGNPFKAVKNSVNAAADGASNISKSVVAVPVDMVDSVKNMVAIAMGSTAEIVDAGVEAGACLLTVPTSMVNDIADAIEGEENGSSFCASA